MKKLLNKIAIIGLGNMGKAIVSGLIKSGNFKKSDFVLSGSNKNSIRAAQEAKVIILAVRPNIVPNVLTAIKPYLSGDKVLVSVAARLTIDDIKDCIGTNHPIVRVMPNICASVGQSMSCWVKSDEVSDTQMNKVKFILRSLGEEIMLENESLFDVVTVISGSGPAYFLHLADLFFDFAQQMELEPKLTEKLIQQTLFGTASLLMETDKSVKSLMDNIASKGGTTETVLKILDKEHFGKIFLKALNAGYKRTSRHQP